MVIWSYSLVVHVTIVPDTQKKIIILKLTAAFIQPTNIHTVVDFYS